jgi:YesN/AraC family two-component response regulator
MTLYIKNMVCSRCIMAVQQILQEANISYKTVRLGEVDLCEIITDEKNKSLSENLNSIGFELIDDRKSRIIEKIKSLVIELVHYSSEQSKSNLSDYLSEKLHYDYKYLSNLFSEIAGTTIEKYYIVQKVEKIKELLVYDELSISEIAYKMGYSSVAYLSNQFKKVTGLSPSHFKNIPVKKRISLDKV